MEEVRHDCASYPPHQRSNELIAFPTIDREKESRRLYAGFCPVDGRAWALRLLSSRAVSSLFRNIREREGARLEFVVMLNWRDNNVYDKRLLRRILEACHAGSESPLPVWEKGRLGSLQNGMRAIVHRCALGSPAISSSSTGPYAWIESRLRWITCFSAFPLR